MLFLANTTFELELENPSLFLQQALSSHPNFLQLQYLFSSLASKEDGIIVTNYPSEDYKNSLQNQGFEVPHFLLLEEVKSRDEPLTVWGATENIQRLFPSVKWPPIDAVKKLSSKLSAHELSPLPGSQVLYNEKDLEEFPDGLIKLPHGFSGRGNIPKSQTHRLQNLLFPVLGEPLKKRIFDFSTHWEIRNGELFYLGATELKNTSWGSYIGNLAGNKLSFPEFIEEQKAFVFSKKEEILKIGYFGPLSMDAMIYEESGEKLQPIIEINPRKTMGSFTLSLWKKWGVDALQVSYEKNVGQVGLLPREKIFSKQLTYTVYR